MKKISTLLMLLSMSISAFAVTVTWSSAAGGEWGTGANWVGGSAPAQNTDVVINATQNMVITFGSTTLASQYTSLTVTGAFTVEFQYASTTSKTMLIAGPLSIASGGRVVVTGTTVNADGSYSNGKLLLSLSGGTSVINGGLHFMGAGAGFVHGTSTTTTFNDTIAVYGGTGGAANFSWSSGTINFGATGVLYVGRNGSTGPSTYSFNSASKIAIVGNRKPDKSAISAGFTAFLTLGGISPYSLPNIIIDVPGQTAAVASALFSSTTAVYNVQSIDLVNTNSQSVVLTGTTGSTVTTTVNVSGNFNVGSTSYARLYNSTGGTSTFNVTGNVTNSGVINIMSNTGTGVTFNVAGNYTGTGQTFANATSTLRFNGTGAQNLTLPNLHGANVNVNIQNANNVTLGSSIDTIRSLSGLLGKLILGSYNIAVNGATGSFTGSSSNYLVTNGTGKAIIVNVPTSGKNFPIGISTSSYDPIGITPASASTFSASVKSGFTNSPSDASKDCNREWDVTSSSTNALLEFEPDATATCPTATTEVVGHYVSGLWTETTIVPVATRNTNGNFAYRYGASFTSFSPFGTGNQCGFNGPTTSILANALPTSICEGGTANLKTTITGGVGPHTIVYSGGTVNSYTSAANIPVMPVSTTMYSLTSVTDSRGCIATTPSGTPTVIVNARPTVATLAGDATICVGATANLNVVVGDGLSPYTVVTSAGATTGYTSAANLPVTPTMTTMYSLTSVTDANGCVATMPSGTPTVTVNPINSAVITGDWSNVATWAVCGVVPVSLSDVVIPAGVVVTLDAANPTINSLTFTGGGQLQLNSNDITVTGATTGDAAVGYAITNGTGKLKSPIGAGATKTFPIGGNSSTYSPVTATPTSATTFGASVSNTINPTHMLSPAAALAAGSREWDLSSTAPSATTLAFTPNDSRIDPTGAVKLGHWGGTKWDADIAATFSGSGATGTFTGIGSTFSPYIVSEALAPLAVEFTNITAQAKGSINVINFSTATEKDVKAFDIERSVNNRTWEVIGTVAAKGGTTTANYSFNDVNPTALSYYRVRSVETNGKDQISKIVAVKRNGGKLAVNMVSPVPTTEGVNVDFSTSKIGTLNVVITDIVGKIVKTERFTTVEGNNLMRLNLSNLSVGTYILSMNDGETVATQRIVKQ